MLGSLSMDNERCQRIVEGPAFNGRGELVPATASHLASASPRLALCKLVHTHP